MPAQIMTAFYTALVLMTGLIVDTRIAYSSFEGPDEKGRHHEINHDPVVSDLKPQEQSEVYKTVGEDWEKGFNDEGMSRQQGRRHHPADER